MLLFLRKHRWITGLLTALASFLLLFAGVRGVLKNEIGTNNLLFFLGFSIIAGIAASLLAFYRLKAALISFFAGLAAGFLMMYRSFINGMSGWGDIIGIMSLLTWVIVGLGLGLIIQLVFYLYRRHKKR